MDQSANCPRCDQPLVPDDKVSEILRCEPCHGTFIPASQLESDLPGGSEASDATSEPHAEPAEDQPQSTNCPVCKTGMTAVRLDSAVLFHCESCGGAWADGDQHDSAEPESASGRLSRFLLYSLTLPERAVRSGVGVTAGAAKEAAEFLVPSAFQNSKTYEVVVCNSLRFLTEDVGGVAGKSDEPELGKDFAARKAVGNFVDLAGWATLAFSPVWVMAIVSDVAYGSKSYIRELAAELKKKGLIDENSTINNVDDVLAAVQDASGKAASLVDMPPLSVKQLKETLNETRAAIASANFRKVLPEAELKSYWNEMREISKREDVSLIGVSGALTMHTLGKVGTVSRGALTGVQVVGGMFNRHVIGHYTESLKAVKERGFYQTVRESSQPYVEAVWNNFASDKTTWTEEIVTGRALGRAVRAVTGWFSRSKDAKDADTPSEDHV